MGYPGMPDDFDFSDENFEAETQLNILEEAKIKILKIIKEEADKTIKNIELKLPGEEKSSFQIISRYVSAIVDINSMGDEMTEEEMIEAIKKIENSVSEISYGDLLYQPDEEDFDAMSLLPGSENDESKNDTSGDTDSGLDF